MQIGGVMETIAVRSKLYDYTVDFVEDFSSKLEEFRDRAVYVIDRNVYGLYADQFAGLDKRYVYFMDPTEDRKSMETVMEIIRLWQTLGVRKDWKVLCFGGGITQDVTTVAGCLFLRNVEWYFFPTTLLSMCDSCIGGKCGINLGIYKNQIGVFYPPRRIFIDVRFLDTLPEADYLNGWGEILKFSLTAGRRFYEDLKKEPRYIPCEHIGDYIYRGLLVKKAVIEEDEFESDRRRVLNYGHTFGHALEAYTDHRVPHGKAVIWGIDVVNYIAWREGITGEEGYRDVKKLIMEKFLMEEIRIKDPGKLFDIIRTDKKVRGDTLAFAMPDGDGGLMVHPLPIDGKLKRLFMEYLEETHDAYGRD